MIAMDEKPLQEPQFAAEKDGLFFENMRIEKDIYGNMIGRVHIINHTGRSLSLLNTMDAEVNDIRLVASLETNGLTYTLLPDGFDLWCDYLIYTQSYEDGMKKEIIDLDPCDIYQLEWHLTTKTKEKIVVSLLQ